MNGLSRAARLLGRDLGEMPQLNDFLGKLAQELEVPERGELVIAVDVDFDGFIHDNPEAMNPLPAQGILLASARPASGKASSAADTARTEAAREGSPLDVRGISDLGDLLAELGIMKRLEERSVWSPRSRELAARTLFEESRTASWVPVGWWWVSWLASVLLEHVVDEQEFLRNELRFARDVALRHTGRSVLLEIPNADWFEPQPSEHRLEVAAHVVQSAADADLELVSHHVAWARCLLPEGNRVQFPPWAA